jgi:RNA polymerase sigma factor (TIGR02999 family)
MGGVANTEAGEVTVLLRAWHAGDEDAYRQVSSILYTELRQEAARRMRASRPGDTLQTTALVHETFIRLAGAHQVDWQDRKHFLAVAGRTVRRLLIDLARGHASAKRGARADHVPLDSDVAAEGPPPLGLIALDRALRKSRRARRAQGAGGRAQVLCRADGGRDRRRPHVSPDTVARDWRMARTWLLRELSRARG